jgi:teichuronic acid biosynthesis glycosyltransferase TuaG
MPDLRSGQDYAFWLSILKGDCAAFLIPSPMTYYRVLPNSLSRNKFKKAARQWQIYRKIEQLSLAKSVWAFKSYAINALTR